jgi:hypothetical protein
MDDGGSIVRGVGWIGSWRRRRTEDNHNEKSNISSRRIIRTKRFPRVLAWMGVRKRAGHERKHSYKRIEALGQGTRKTRQRTPTYSSEVTGRGKQNEQEEQPGFVIRMSDAHLQSLPARRNIGFDRTHRGSDQTDRSKREYSVSRIESFHSIRPSYSQLSST